jgi:PAS domain S-box-containing protein
LIRSLLHDKAREARSAAVREAHRGLGEPACDEPVLLRRVCEALCGGGGYLGALVAERRPDRTIRVAGRAGEIPDPSPETLPFRDDPSSEFFLPAARNGKTGAFPIPAGEGARLALVVATASKDGIGSPESEDLEAVASRLGQAIAGSRAAARLDSLKKVCGDQAAELEAERDFSSRLLGLVREPVVRLGPEGEIRMVNRAFESVTGYRAADLMNRRMADLLLPEEARSGFRRLLVEMFIGREAGTAAFPLSPRSGVPFRVAWDFSALPDPVTGKVASVLACGIPTKVSEPTQ